MATGKGPAPANRPDPPKPTTPAIDISHIDLAWFQYHVAMRLQHNAHCSGPGGIEQLKAMVPALNWMMAPDTLIDQCATIATLAAVVAIRAARQQIEDRYSPEQMAADLDRIAAQTRSMLERRANP